ncbi:MAG: hypothetical protein U1F11_13935 [Steroidobacteraceae bacterium]
MNELQYIRAQVALERGHMASVRLACQQALALPEGALPPAELADFCTRCAQYLVFIGRRFNAQDQAHADQLRAVPGVTADPARGATSTSTRRSHGTGAALELLAATPGPRHFRFRGNRFRGTEPVAGHAAGEAIVAACRAIRLLRGDAGAVTVASPCCSRRTTASPSGGALAGHSGCG